LTYLFEQRSVEAEIITEEGIGTSEAHVALEGSMPIQTSNDSWCRRVRTCLWSLCANAEEIVLQVSIEEVGVVGSAACG
jgi:hypothetical protein